MSKPRRIFKAGPHATEATSTRFGGEMMACAICGEEGWSDPGRESQWRYVAADGKGHHVCPLHFPPDTGTVEEFLDAYVDLLTALLGDRS